MRGLWHKLSRRNRSPQIRRRPGEPVLVHVHIPKCAGSTFKQILSRTFGERHLDWYSTDPFFVFEPDEIAARLEQQPELESIATHSIRSFPPHLGDRMPLYVTFLRNPIDQFVSYITFLKKNKPYLSDTHRLYVPPDVEPMTVRDIAQWLVTNPRPVPFRDNYTVFFLAQQEFRRLITPLNELLDGNAAVAAPTDTFYEQVALPLAIAVLERFFFVGIVEEMERSVSVLADRLKGNGFELDHVNFQRENVSSHLRGDLDWLNESDEVGRLVFQSLDKDLQLYRHFKAHLHPESPSD